MLVVPIASGNNDYNFFHWLDVSMLLKEAFPKIHLLPHYRKDAAVRYVLGSLTKGGVTSI